MMSCQKFLLHRAICGTVFLLLVRTAVSLNNCEKSEETAYQTLLADFYRWKQRSNPESASLSGVHGYDAELAPLSLDASARADQECQDFIARADVFLNAEIPIVSGMELHYVKLIRRQCSELRSGLALGGHLLAPVTFLRGRQTTLAQNFNRTGFFRSTSSPSDWALALARLSAVKANLEEAEALLRAGVERGVTHAKESLGERVAWQFRKQFLDFDQIEGESGFFGPFRDIRHDNATLVESVKASAKDVIYAQVIPALRKLYDYVSGEYSDHLRPAPGVNNVADGEAFYQKCLEYHTSMAGLTALQIHDFGLEEVDKLKAGLRNVSRQLGYGDNLTATEFFDKIASEPDQGFSSEEEVLEHCTSILFDRINPSLSKVFSERILTPKLWAIEVKKAPEGSGIFAFYSFPRPPSGNATFYIGLDDLTSIKRYQLLSLTLHEANPGHHVDYTVFGADHDFPGFLPARGAAFAAPATTPSYTAFVEGWALYAESLGFELGLYEDPHDLAGYYNYNLLRAARLVVDTGLHKLGWSRQRAVDYMLANTGMANSTVQNEVDRYISWPGQAVAYKVGERAIRDLRRKQQEEMGDKFDLKRFHDHLLPCKGPMDMLEECMRLVALEENKKETTSASSRPIFSHVTTTAIVLLIVSIQV